MQSRGTTAVFFQEEKKLVQILKHVDMVLEVLDARLPLSSRNSRLAGLFAAKGVIIMNKADLAEKKITGRWLDFFYQEGYTAVPFTVKSPAALKELEKKLLQRKRSGLKFQRPLRLMVAGIPNVGKSSLINCLAGRFALRTGARPGITRGPQWIRLRAGWEMLDTPGLLPPYLRSKSSKLPLALIGALEKDLPDAVEVARFLLSRIVAREALYKRFLNYYLGKSLLMPDYDAILQQLGRARGCLGPGGVVNLDKAANLLINDFRRGALGRISLEEPAMAAEASGCDHEEKGEDEN